MTLAPTVVFVIAHPAIAATGGVICWSKEHEKN